MSKLELKRVIRVKRALGVNQCRADGMTYKDIGIKYNISTSRAMQVSNWFTRVDGFNLDNTLGVVGSEIKSYREYQELIRVAREELKQVNKR